MKNGKLNGLYITESQFASGTILPEVRCLRSVGMIADFATTDFQDFTNWLYCDGRLLQAEEYPILFAKIGHKFGGSGSTFAIPDLRGLVTSCASTEEPIGKKEGEKTHTLTIKEMPSHFHATKVAFASNWASGTFIMGSGAQAGRNDGTQSEGGNAPHNNMQPTIYLAKFIYAL